MKPNLKPITEPNRIVGSIMSIISILLWLPFFLQTDINQSIAIADHLSFCENILINKHLALGITLILTILNGLFISAFNYQLRITKEQNVFPVNLYILSVALIPGLNTQFDLQVSLLLIQISNYLFHKIYKIRIPVEEVFQVTLCLSISTLLVPETIIFFVFLFLFLIFQNKLKLRVFLSILIGIFVSSSLLFIYFHYSDTWTDFVAYLRSLYVFDKDSCAIFNHFSLKDIVSISLLITGILAIISYILTYFQYTYQVRSTINNLIIVFFILTPLILLKINTYENFTLIWNAILCVLVTNLFVGKTNWYKYVLFYLFILVQLAYYILQFTPYLNTIKIPYC